MPSSSASRARSSTWRCRPRSRSRSSPHEEPQRTRRRARLVPLRTPEEAGKHGRAGPGGGSPGGRAGRYSPAGEVSGHLLGFTNVDDAGQEGLELAFDHWLAGEDGSKRVIQDRYGRIVQNVESIRPARPGRDLVLSIDLRIQYLAYRELKAAIRDQRARGVAAGALRRPR